jgi:cytochrome c oxidase subunit 2
VPEGRRTRAAIGSRRAWLAAAASLLSLGLAAGYAAAQSERVIKVRVKKFVFTPAQIALRKGEPVVLELTTEDVFMGFSAPELGVRADIIPGKTGLLRLTPQQAGKFDFVCDVFCGDKHEEMQGQIVVS